MPPAPIIWQKVQQDEKKGAQDEKLCDTDTKTKTETQNDDAILESMFIKGRNNVTQ
jgi:hypothetical protein